MRFILVLSTLALASCANNTANECGDKFLLPWFNSEGVAEFKEVHLSTLNSPYRLKGSAAEIFYEGALTTAGYAGSPAEPKLTKSGHVCVPMDAGSAVAISAYAHFEDIYKFDRELGVDRQITWPRKVGVELNLRSPDGQTHNNAHYFGRSDSIGVLPFSMGGRHLALNKGILAHEHFHAHFQSQVLNPLAAGSDVISSLIENLFYLSFAIKPIEDLDGADVKTAEGLNRFVLRSWNEGLADYYGAVVAGESDFFSSSLPGLSAFRELDGPLKFFRTGDALRPVVSFADPSEIRIQRRELLGVAYEQGTLLGRLLFRISKVGGIEQKELLRRMMLKLHRIPTLVIPHLERKVMDFEIVVPLLLEGVELNEDACQALRATLSKPAILRSFQQCGV